MERFPPQPRRYLQSIPSGKGYLPHVRVDPTGSKGPAENELNIFCRYFVSSCFIGGLLKNCLWVFYLCILYSHINVSFVVILGYLCSRITIHFPCGSSYIPAFRIYSQLDFPSRKDKTILIRALGHISEIRPLRRF